MYLNCLSQTNQDKYGYTIEWNRPIANSRGPNILQNAQKIVGMIKKKQYGKHAKIVGKKNLGKPCNNFVHHINPFYP